MSKRQAMRERQTRTQRTRAGIILIVALAALLIAGALILNSHQTANPVNLVQVTPLAATVKVNNTSRGDPNAPVKMDVWIDFQCSGCDAYSKDPEPKVLETLVDTGKVYYTVHFYPFIDGGQGESHDAANAALCASAQGRFWDFHSMAFANWIGENVGSYTRPRLISFAQALGLDMTAFNTCFSANTYANVIQQDIDAGNKLGVPPTPGIFINGKPVPASAGANYLQSYDDIAKAVAAAAAGK